MRLTAPPRAAIVPAIVALVSAALLGGATVWAAKPVYGLLHAEFGWSPAALAASALASLVATAVAAAGWRWRSPRRAATSGLLVCGVIALLALPNLTHLWQLVLALLALGVARGVALRGLWRVLRLGAGRTGAGLALAAAFVAGIWPAASVVAVTVYRNSWREGVAACGGLLLALATPLAYVLLPGAETPAPSATPSHDGTPLQQPNVRAPLDEAEPPGW